MSESKIPIGRPALVAAIVGPVQSVAGWLIAGAFWPGFDHFGSTISDLAALDSPVWPLMSAFFLLGATLTIVAGVYARSFALPGRIVLVLAGIATYGLTVFQSPAQDEGSTMHRIFAGISFILMSAWPMFAIRWRGKAPWPLKPIGGILATVAFAAMSIWFLLVWLDPMFTAEGLAERLMVTAQAWYLSLAILVVWRFERHNLQAGVPPGKR